MKILNGLEQIAFTTDRAHQCAFGMVNGYKFLINFEKNSITTTIKPKEDTTALEDYFETFDKGQFINWAIYKNNTVVINLKDIKTLNAWDVDKIMKDVSAIAQQNGYVQCCRQCGQETEVQACVINGNNDLLCANCIAQLAANQGPVKKSNMPLGIIGAFLGSFVGVIVWVIISQLNFIAGIAGFVMALGCFKGYELFAGRIDRKGVWISLIIAIVMVAVSEFIAIAVALSSAADIGIFDSLRLIPYFFESGESIFYILKDLIIGYVLMAFASFGYIRTMFQQVAAEGSGIEVLG